MADNQTSSIVQALNDVHNAFTDQYQRMNERMDIDLKFADLPMGHGRNLHAVYGNDLRQLLQINMEMKGALEYKIAHDNFNVSDVLLRIMPRWIERYQHYYELWSKETADAAITLSERIEKSPLLSIPIIDASSVSISLEVCLIMPLLQVLLYKQLIEEIFRTAKPHSIEASSIRDQISRLAAEVGTCNAYNMTMSRFSYGYDKSVEQKPRPQDDDTVAQRTVPFLAEAIFRYPPEDVVASSNLAGIKEEEHVLKLNVGDIVQVLEGSNEDGWAWGCTSSQYGYFPMGYVRVLDTAANETATEKGYLSVVIETIDSLWQKAVMLYSWYMAPEQSSHQECTSGAKAHETPRATVLDNDRTPSRKACFAGIVIRRYDPVDGANEVCSIDSKMAMLPLEIGKYVEVLEESSKEGWAYGRYRGGSVCGFFPERCIVPFPCGQPFLPKGEMGGEDRPVTDGIKLRDEGQPALKEDHDKDERTAWPLGYQHTWDSVHSNGPMSLAGPQVELDRMYQKSDGQSAISSQVDVQEAMTRASSIFYSVESNKSFRGSSYSDSRIAGRGEFEGGEWGNGYSDIAGLV